MIALVLHPALPRAARHYDGRIVRLNIRLEEGEDLIADLAAALRRAAEESARLIPAAS